MVSGNVVEGGVELTDRSRSHHLLLPYMSMARWSGRLATSPSSS
jgi:hypothetical protein